MRKKESGAIMIEGIIVMVVVLFMLVWILGIGFIYYQRYVVTLVTNDCAVKIADTYYYPSSDIIIGYVEPEDFTNRDLYRFNIGQSLEDANQSKAESFIKKRLEETNFLNTVKNVDVDVEFVKDTLMRKHIEITAVCEFNTPFGAALKFFGMKDVAKYEASAREDCTDKIDYISFCDLESTVFSGNFINEKFTKTAKSAEKLIKSIMNVANHNYN